MLLLKKIFRILTLCFIEKNFMKDLV